MTEAAAQERPVAYRPHPGPQTEFHSRSEYIVLFGGSKFPGKTQALLFESTRQVDKPGYKAIIFRRTFPRLQELMDRAAQFFPRLGAKWEGQAHRWRFPSGATIAFSHCQFENSKFDHQGQEYAFIGFDQVEEFSESQFRYLVAQNRTAAPDVECCIRATANPGGMGHQWVKRRFIAGKVPGKTYWQDLGTINGQKLELTSTYIPATIFDNPTGLKANPLYLANLRSLPDDERKAFLEGDWNAFSTGCIFDAKGMAAQEKMIRATEWVGYLEDAGAEPEFVLDDGPQGRLSVWEHPVDGHRYLIASDHGKGANAGDEETASEKGDNPSAALVIDLPTRAVVARWHGQIDPLDFGKVLFGLGKYYHNALLVPEAWPGPGAVTAAKLVEMGYPNLYERRKWDGKDYEDTGQVGWHTTEQSRADMIAALQSVIRHKKIIIRDQLTLDEMYSFIRKPRSSGRTVKMEARSGCFDDLVVCAAIAACVMENETPAQMFAEKGIGGGGTLPMVVTGGIHLPSRKKTLGHARKTVLAGYR